MQICPKRGEVERGALEWRISLKPVHTIRTFRLLVRLRFQLVTGAKLKVRHSASSLERVQFKSLQTAAEAQVKFPRLVTEHNDDKLVFVGISFVGLFWPFSKEHEPVTSTAARRNVTER